jgi:hypothetical protein
MIKPAAFFRLSSKTATISRITACLKFYLVIRKKNNKPTKKNRLTSSSAISCDANCLLRSRTTDIFSSTE